MFKIVKNYLSISMCVMVNWKSMVWFLSRILTATDFNRFFMRFFKFFETFKNFQKNFKKRFLKIMIFNPWKFKFLSFNRQIFVSVSEEIWLVYRTGSLIHSTVLIFKDFASSIYWQYIAIACSVWYHSWLVSNCDTIIWLGRVQS